MTVLFVFPYSQIIEAAGEAYGLTQSSYALPAWRHLSEDTKSPYCVVCQSDAFKVTAGSIENDVGNRLKLSPTPVNRPADFSKGCHHCQLSRLSLRILN